MYKITIRQSKWNNNKKKIIITTITMAKREKTTTKMKIISLFNKINTLKKIQNSWLLIGNKFPPESWKAPSHYGTGFRDLGAMASFHVTVTMDPFPGRTSAARQPFPLLRALRRPAHRGAACWESQRSSLPACFSVCFLPGFASNESPLASSEKTYRTLTRNRTQQMSDLLAQPKRARKQTPKPIRPVRVQPYTKKKRKKDKFAAI